MTVALLKYCQRVWTHGPVWAGKLSSMEILLAWFGTPFEAVIHTCVCVVPLCVFGSAISMYHDMNRAFGDLY